MSFTGTYIVAPNPIDLSHISDNLYLISLNE